MKYATLKTISRQPKGTRANNRLRKDGLIPGSVLKLDKSTQPISIKKSELMALINSHGRAAVFKLAIDKKKAIFAMIRDIEVLPHTDNILNVILFEVSLKEEIKASVDFRIINEESLLLAKLNTTFYQKSLNVTGLPNNIPDFIDIDAKKLKDGDSLAVKDIVLPEGITADSDPEVIVLAVSSFKSGPATAEVEEDAESDQDAE
ncbi:MAG: 50S ribosomal protein L25 [Clostridiales bacterium]|nr:50S ribosomal protein L25 [Clostridiales bacterium]